MEENSETKIKKYKNRAKLGLAAAFLGVSLSVGGAISSFQRNPEIYEEYLSLCSDISSLNNIKERLNNNFGNRLDKNVVLGLEKTIDEIGTEKVEIEKNPEFQIYKRKTERKDIYSPLTMIGGLVLYTIGLPTLFIYGKKIKSS